MGEEKYNKWRKMDVAELKALIGFKILMAMNNLPVTFQRGLGAEKSIGIASRDPPGTQRTLTPMLTEINLCNKQTHKRRRAGQTTVRHSDKLSQPSTTGALDLL